MSKDKNQLPREKVTREFLEKLTKERVEKLKSGKTVTK